MVLERPVTRISIDIDNVEVGPSVCLLSVGPILSNIALWSGVMGHSYLEGTYSNFNINNL